MPGFKRKAGSSVQAKAKSPTGNTAQVPVVKVKSKSTETPRIADVVIGSADLNSTVSSLAAVTVPNPAVSQPAAKDITQSDVLNANSVSNSDVIRSNANLTPLGPITQTGPVNPVRDIKTGQENASGRNFGAINSDNLIRAVRNPNSGKPRTASRPGSTRGPRQVGPLVGPLAGRDVNITIVESDSINLINEIISNPKPTESNPTGPVPAATPKPISNSSNPDNPTIGYLPTSKADFYLLQNGLTSLYPSIVMTTKRDNSQFGNIDPSSFLIEMNSIVKLTIEQEAAKILQGKSSTNYDTNVASAKNYASLCIDASLKKDNFIGLLNIGNTSLSRDKLQGRTGSRTIANTNYTPLSSATNVKQALAAKNANYPTDVFTVGTNTQTILQFLKTLYYTLLYGIIEFRPTDNPISSGTLYGNQSIKLQAMLSDLSLITIRSLAGSATAPPKMNLLTQQGNPVINFSNFLSGPDIARSIAFLTRDVLIQSKATSLKSISPGETFSRSISGIIGEFNDEFGVQSSTQASTSVITSVNDFLTEINRGSITNVLVKSDNNDRFGVLDTNTQKVSSIAANQRKTGIDYLLYDELSDENSSLQLVNCNNFANDYDANIVSKIYNLWNESVNFSNDQKQKFAIEIANQFKTWLDALSLSKNVSSSKYNDKSFYRACCFFIAAQPGNEKFAIALFRLICALDYKKNNNIQNANALTALNSEIDGLANLIANQVFRQGKALNFENQNGSFDKLPGEMRSGTKSVDRTLAADLVAFKDALKQSGSTSFLQFHTAVRSFENSLGVSKASSGTSIEYANLTDYGSRKSRDARAFAVYAMLLSLLRLTEFRVTTLKGAPNAIITLAFTPIHFTSIKFALNSITKTPSEFEDYLIQIVEGDPRFISPVTSNRCRSTIIKNAKSVFGTHVASMIKNVYDYEKSTYDLLTILNLHSTQLKESVSDLTASLNAVRSFITSNNLTNSESIINSTQREQAYLKKVLVEKYATKLSFADYLPTVTDYNRLQERRTKKVLATHPLMTPGPKKYFIAVGLPAGLLENLRYKNVLSTREDVFSIKLSFRNLQLPQIADSGVEETKVYGFSSRLFVKDLGFEGSSNDGNSWQSIFQNTTLFRYIDDGSLQSINYTDAVSRYSEEIVRNHMLSHYAHLALNMINGIRIDESLFDLRDRSVAYPDPERQVEYLQLFSDYTQQCNLKDTTEDKLFLQRVMNDVARSTYLSPRTHFLSMTTARKFDRVLIIPVDLSTNGSGVSASFLSNDITFPLVFSEIILRSGT